MERRPIETVELGKEKRKVTTREAASIGGPERIDCTEGA